VVKYWEKWPIRLVKHVLWFHGLREVVMLQAVDQSSFMKSNKPIISKFLEAGFKRDKIARVYNINYQVLRDDKITAAASEALRPLTQLVPYFVKIFRGDFGKIVSWLNEGNVAFHGLTPIEMIYMRREEDVMKFLQSHLDPENREVFRG
jgi:hypothetical protein